MTHFGEEKQLILVQIILVWCCLTDLLLWNALLQDIGDDTSFLSLKRMQRKLMGDIWVLLTEGEKGLSDTPILPLWTKDRHVPLVWHMEGKGWMAAAWLLLCLSLRALSTKGPRWAPPPHLHAGGCWGVCWLWGRMSQLFWSSFKLTYKCKGFFRLSRQRLLLSLGAVTTFGDAALVSFCEVLHKGSGCQRPGDGNFLFLMLQSWSEAQLVRLMQWLWGVWNWS